MFIVAQVKQRMAEIWNSSSEGEKLGLWLQHELEALIALHLTEDTASDIPLPSGLLQLAYTHIPPDFEFAGMSRLSFLEFASPLFRKLLVDCAREPYRAPGNLSDTAHGGKCRLFFNVRPSQFLALDMEFTRLTELDYALGRAVDLRLFGGMNDDEVGTVLEQSPSQVKSEWRFSRAWIFDGLTSSLASSSPPSIGGNGAQERSPSSAPATVGWDDAEAEHVDWTAGQWLRLKKLFQEGVQQRYSEQSSWLRNRCESDRNLEMKLGLLLRADRRARKFLEVAEQDTVDYSLSEHLSHSLECGDIISGRFKIVRFVDSGGMGEVYEAWDLELQERVALKTIRPELASAPTVIERFKREVKQARGISHPNVCRVYDLFSHGESSFHRVWFLTMELLEGETLLDRVRRAPLSLQDGLDVAKQLVSGLKAAHRLGIVHRDLKSSNVMLIEEDGGRSRAVIMDFGLAIDTSPEQLPFLEPAGQGTPDYMAPEQKQSGPVGTAADQYALGVVLCEMVTGKRPVRKGGLKAGLEESPALPSAELPPRWERVIRRCLEVLPEDRYTDVGDVIAALHPATRRARVVWKSAVAVAAIVVALMLFWPRKPRLERFAQITSGTDLSGEPSLSPDGKTIAYSSDSARPGNLDIWVKHLPAGTPVRITTNEGQDVDPSISPDGSSVVFRSSRAGGGIYISDSAGERLLVPGGRNPQFSPDGNHIAYWTGDEDPTTASGSLYVLSLAQGSPVRLARGFADARVPIWSSDGRHLLFTGCRDPKQPMPACADWWVTSVDGSELVSTGAMSILRKQQMTPVYLGGWSGNTVFFNAKQRDLKTLWELPLSATTLRASGEPQAITDIRDIDQSSSLAQNGTIAFSEMVGALHIWQIANASQGEQAPITKVTQDAMVDLSPYISHNGRWLVFSRGFGPHNLYLQDTQSGHESVLLASNIEKYSPIIDDTGNTVAFEVRDKEIPSILQMHRNQLPTVLCTGCSKPTSWFNGSTAVLYREGIPSRIKMADIRTGQSRTLLESPGASLSEADWSRETQYLVFTASTDNGKKRVFAVLVPRTTGTPEGPWIPITSDSESSDTPHWSGDGKTIFYLSTRDGFSCLFGQRFDPVLRRPTGPPFIVHHFHDPKISPETVSPDSFELSVVGDSIYLNLGEVSASIWTGVLKDHGYSPVSIWQR